MNKLSTALSLCLILLPVFPAPAEDKKPGKASPERTTDKVEFIFGPDYADAPELTVKPGTPQGTVHEFVIKSVDSKIYPGIAKNQPGTVPYERKVARFISRSNTAPVRKRLLSSPRTTWAIAATCPLFWITS